MQNLALLVLCFLAGMLLRRFNKFNEQSHLTINDFIIYISLPGLIIKNLRFIPVTTAYFSAALMPWIIFIICIPIFLFFSRKKLISRETALCLILTGGLGNTSFVGIPVIEALYGAQYVPIGIVIDQLGTFLVVSLLGITLIDFFLMGKFHFGRALTNLINFPPFIAILFAGVFLYIKPPEILYTIADRLGATLAPLALVSVGMQWKTNALRHRRFELFLGLGYKLILAPLIILILYSIFDYVPDLKKIVLLEASMGPMITGGIIAMSKNLNPALASAMISVGIPLSLIPSLIVKYGYP